MATTATTYLLIVVGALVRSLGAGMGCPDWPRCYGGWIPPQTLAAAAARLAWIEYMNRALGMATGLLTVATFALAWADHRRHRRVVVSSLGAMIGVGVAGWLGKRVVERHLASQWVTVHLFVAFAVIALLIDAVIASIPRHSDAESGFGWFALSERRRESVMGAVAVGAAAFVQVAIGTRVRTGLESVARVAPSIDRRQWMNHLGPVLSVHRGAALLVLILGGALAAHTYRFERQPSLRKLAAAIVCILVVQIAVGVGLASLALPPLLQIAHVALASLVVGAVIVFGLLATRLAERGDPEPTAMAHSQTE